jgi:predicted dehydrogenase
MDQLRIGMIGCGQIARSHMKNYAGIKGAKMVAMCDISAEAVGSAAKEYGVDPKDTYSDFRKMLERSDIDAVDVCLHNNFHAPVTIEALRAGKHVYCEKPMAGSYADALNMLKVRDETGKKLSIQLAMIFSNETRAAKTLIDEGHLGKVYHARSTGHRRRGRPFVDGYGTMTFVQKRNSAGGALYDMGVYHISRLLYLMGNPNVERISGKTYQEIEIDPKRLAASGYDVEELGLGFVRFAGNLSLDIIEAWAIHLDKMDGSVVLGSKGGVRLDPFGYFHNMGDVSMSATADLGNAGFRWANVHGTADWYQSPQHHWVNAHLGKVPLLPTAEIALNTMLISEGIYMSERLGREVTAQEVRENSVSTAVKV